MDITIVALALGALLILFMGMSLWIGLSLLLVGLSGFILFTDLPYGSILANAAWNNTVALP